MPLGVIPLPLVVNSLLVPVFNRIAAVLVLLACFASLVVASRRPKEATLSLNPSGDRILKLELEGTIGGGGPSGLLSVPAGAETVRDQLIEAARDDSVRGILLRIDSPGGTVGTSQEVYNAVLAARARKPVVVSMGDTAASGGYYIACAADRIFANPGTLTGSIGVIISSYDISGLLERFAINPQVIKSGKYKDILSINRALSVEEKAILQSVINDTYSQFVSAVARGRNLSASRVRELADGRIYTGQQARKAGLVDSLGDYQAALKDLRGLIKARFPDLNSDELPVKEPGSDLELGRLVQLLNIGGGTTTRLPLQTGPAQPLWLAPSLAPQNFKPVELR